MRLRRGVFLSVLLLSALVGSVFNTQNTFAAQITTRSLTLVAGASDGGSKPGGVVNHKFTFTIPSTTAIGSIQLQYCTTASGTCTLPTGVVTTSATLATGSTGYASGTTLNNTTNGAPYITKTAANGSGATTFQLNTVTNPTATNTTFYVRISTFAATNATGTAIDTGTVAASTATQVVLTGTMPESLIFCVGAAITATNNIPDCTTATAGTIAFDQLFSPTDTATAQSKMAASTNAASGYSITVNGPTLTSGSNTIPAMTTSTTAARGIGQFGLNLKANTLTTASQPTGFGAEIAVASDGTNYRGQAAVGSGYDTVNNFKFASGDVVANSANGGAGPSNGQIYTASYIVDVAGNQASGTYTSTLTYICTATF